MRKYNTDGKSYDVSRGTEKRFALSAEVVLEFELGLKIPCVFGYNPNNDFIFYIGEKVEQIPDSDKIKVTAPHFPAKLSEELHETYIIDKNNYVINNKTLEQIHPVRGREENSRLEQFIKTVTYSKMVDKVNEVVDAAIEDVKETISSLIEQSLYCYDNPKMQGGIVLLEKIKIKVEESLS